MKSFFLLFFLLCCHFSNGQLETKNWFLNQNRIAVIPSGITTGLAYPSPTVYFSSGAKTASVSDEAGNLLFAFNGNTIVDRNLAVMPALTNIYLQSGFGKLGIQKIPASPRYLVFYTTSNNNSNINASWTLKYALVDLTLNNGNGDVVSYNNIIDANSSQAFTLVQGANPMTAWLVTHRCATDSFFNYRVTSSGIAAVPVVSRAGTVATTQDYIYRDLKTSYDGKMVAGVTYRNYTQQFAMTYGFTEVFTFNDLTGLLTYKIRTPRLNNYFSSYHSIEFSPDNKLLYIINVSRIAGIQPCGYGYGFLTQYNLCYTDSAAFYRYSMRVAENFQWCNPFITWGYIQMGADKRIHMPFSGTIVSSINKPNRIGTSCDFIFNSYQLPNSNGTQVMTPDFHHKLMEKPIKNNIVYEGGCYPNPITFSITNDTINSISWNFGDPASANNTSALLSPSHLFSSPGIYTVTAQLYNSQNGPIETVIELVEIKDPAKRVLDGYPADTSFCSGNELKISLQVVNGIYHWFQLSSNGNIIGSTVADSIIINATGKWYVEMKQNDCNGCTMIDSINVTVLPKPNFSLGNDRTLCQGDSILLAVYDPDARYIWNTGATTSSIWAYQGGVYWVQAEYNNNGCPRRDSILITQVPGVNFILPPDTTLCNNQTLLLNPSVPNANYLWQNGSTQTTFNVTQAGTYWVKITSTNSCSKTDTIHVNYINFQQVYLGNDTTLCTGSSLLLQTNILNAQYLWSTGSANNQITVNQSGSYWIRVYNGVCTVSDTITVTFSPPPVLFLGRDTTICKQSQLVLSPGISNAVYTWQNGSHTNTFTVTQPGIYWLEIKQNSCVVRDTITVSYYTVPDIILGPDISFCFGDSALLNAGTGFSQYKWSNGMNTQQVKVYTPGAYSVIGTTANGCKSMDTLRVISLYPLPVIELGTGNAICIGDNLVLDAGAGFSQYIWNTGGSSQTITVNNMGWYAVGVTDQNGCRGYDTLYINMLLPLPAGFLPADTAICSYGSLTLRPLASFNRYQWSTGSTTPSINISQPGTYWLMVRDYNNCNGKDSIIVTPKDCMKGVFIPTVFTPNNDGKNDTFMPLVFGNILQYSFTVYNRWGQVVFNSTTPGSGWNGLYGSLLQDTNVFTWTCRYQLSGEAIKLEKGTVLLLR